MNTCDNKSCCAGKCHRGLGTLGCICLILVIIGGINWGLIGAFSFNVVGLLGNWPALERIIYIVIGVAAIILIFLAIKCCRCHSKCHSASCSTSTCSHSHTNDKIPPQI